MYSFKKTERLKSKKIIEKLFSDGNSINEYPFRLVWLETGLTDQHISAQATFSVSKRRHSRAVVRNRIKRLMREAYRLNKLSLYAYLEEMNKTVALMFIYTGEKLPPYFEVEDKIIKLINRLPGEMNEKRI